MTRPITKRNKATDRYEKLNDYELVSCYMEYDNGGRVDLRPLFHSISFVEDMNVSAMSGQILLKDSVDLLNSFPISGHEKIYIEYRTPGIDADYESKTFRVVEVSDRVRSKDDKNEVYKIKFVSETAYINPSIKISRSVKGKISDIASGLYREFLGGNLIVQPTSGEYKFILPYWTPFKTLEWLAMRAIPKKSQSETNYFFFENMDGHNFVSLSSLSDQEPLLQYYLFPMNISVETKNKLTDIERKFLNVQEYSFIKTNQKMKEFMDGAFSSVLLQHDITTKSWSEKIYNYNKEEGKIRGVGEEKVTRNNSLYTRSPNVKRLFTTKQTQVGGKDYQNIQNHEDWLQNSMASKVLFDTIKTRIRVPGNSRLRAGNIIELFIPKSGPVEQTPDEWYDEMLSGKYLISSVRHIFVGEEYTSVLMLVKNKYEKPLPDQANFLGSDSKTDNNLLRVK